MDSGLLGRIVGVLNEYYIVQRWKYLILHSDGEYNTAQYFKKSKNNRYPPLTDNALQHHLNGGDTIGVCCACINHQYVSKFMTFDIDSLDTEITDKVITQLRKNGIFDIAVSFSGGKGYHVDIFFDNCLPIKILDTYYQHVLQSTGLIYLKHGSNYVVEMRPTEPKKGNVGNGVKIPLGHNWASKNKTQDNYCCYVDYRNGYLPIDTAFVPAMFSHIEKIDSNWFRLLCDGFQKVEYKNQAKQYSEIKARHKPLPQYQQGTDIDCTVDALQKLEEQGLPCLHSRVKSLFKLARYYYWCGLEQQDCKDTLSEWMEQQDKTKYATSLSESKTDIENIANYVYDNNLGIINTPKDISVSYGEIKQILKAKTKAQKLLCFAMLIHSKRYATKTGKFYFPYSLMMQSTGIQSDKTIYKAINQLAEQGLIQISSRNQKQSKTKIKATNIYQMLIDNTNDEKYIVSKDTEAYESDFKRCIKSLIPQEELKHICSRRMLEYIG